MSSFLTLTLRSWCAGPCEYWLGWSSTAVQILCREGLHLRLRADPARRGLSAAVVRWLLACGARTIVYVSCHLATQVRHLLLSKSILARGKLATSAMPGFRADHLSGCLAGALAGREP